jgi:hypothetical protein
MQVEVLFSAGRLPMRTVGEPEIQGAAVTGTQGAGVGTPDAAVVAEATSGFASDWHIPKVGMFISGAKSMMVPAGAPHRVRLVGSTFRVLGETPNEHIIMAPDTTS